MEEQTELNLTDTARRRGEFFEAISGAVNDADFDFLRSIVSQADSTGLASIVSAVEFIDMGYAASSSAEELQLWREAEQTCGELIVERTAQATIDKERAELANSPFDWRQDSEITEDSDDSFHFLNDPDSSYEDDSDKLLIISQAIKTETGQAMIRTVTELDEGQPAPAHAQLHEAKRIINESPNEKLKLLLAKALDIYVFKVAKYYIGTAIIEDNPAYLHVGYRAIQKYSSSEAEAKAMCKSFDKYLFMFAKALNEKAEATSNEYLSNSAIRLVQRYPSSENRKRLIFLALRQNI